MSLLVLIKERKVFMEATLQSKSAVLIEIKGNLGILILNRPDCLNAMNEQLVEDFHTALTELKQNDDIRVIILTGMGRAFCAGGDLRYIESLSDKTTQRAFIKRVGEMALSLRQCPKPVIAMVNGVAAGAGVNLMLACDIVCSSDKAKFIQSFVNVGLVPDCGGMYLLPEAIGLQKAKELMFTADVVTAQKALDLNLVTHLYSPESLNDETMKLASKIATGAPKALAQMKLMLNESYSSFADFLAKEADVQVECLNSHDCAEGIAAFKQKRKPNFMGK